MKFAFILYEYFPFGGLQNDCLTIVKCCEERGHDVTIFTRSWEGPHPDFMEVVTLGSRGIGNIMRNVNFHRRLQPLLSESDFDVKVGFNRMPGLDIYYAADACYQAKTERLKGAWFRWTRRFRHYRDWEEAIFRKGTSTHILLITPHEVPDYNRFYQTEEARLHVLPPGIQRREFSESLKRNALVRVRKELSVAEGKNILLFVGRGFRTKGLDRAIRGIASLSEQLRLNSTLVVLGESKPGRFKVLANRLEVGDRVLFLWGAGGCL